MKNYYNQILFLTGTALAILAAQSSQAANNQIAKVELNSLEHGIELRLHTDGKLTKNLSFFTVNQKNKLEANLLNTDLNLPQGKSFSKKNPFPGIASLEIKQIDGEHTQISIATEPDFPVEQLLQEQGQEIILSLLAEAQGNKSESKLNFISQLVTEKFNSAKEFITAQLPTNVEEKTYTPPPNTSGSNPNILVPNPEIIIGEGKNNNEQNEITPPSEPAYLPRAVAPPVGDMAVSNLNTNPDLIDLGSSAVVPRLVLRDAPVREVLSLLARSAGLNVVFAQGTQAQAAGQPGAEVKEQTVSLDLENQPVQEVFNSVLLISGLNANRQGNIIYVGEKLPAQARNLVSRTIRLNQVRAENAALFLASQGAEGQRLTTEVEEVIDQDTGRVVQRKEKPAQLQSLQGASGGGEVQVDNTSPQLLKGLQLATDDRLNSITLVGEPRKVETATAFLTQLDARRRQVAVNVKVIDVNLLNEDLFNSSFSFGINDTFFVQDQGSAIMNFGNTKPPNTAQVTTSQFFPTIIPLEVPGAELSPFFDIVNNAMFGNVTRGSSDFLGGNLAPYARPNFGSRSNPFRPGVSDVNDDEIEYTLPSLFQFPKQFLASLEAQITSGNAKVLTDPTLMVQEGQQATVKLAQNVVESVETEIDAESGTRTITPVIAEAGLVLTVNVERIDDNGFIGLSVSPSVTSVGQTQEFDSGGGATNVLNLLSKREVSSGLIRLRDGQTLILSGIIQDQERTTVSKVPILGDIPLLGSLFRSTDKTNERAEVIVLLTPQVVDEQAGFGYNYRPGQEAREMLQQQGFTLPNNP
ncbi:type II and III secretion system protein [Stanieria sp. NIES-3757]|nr:type II and III secretion system protein [Stanieria sp. NIES-3757]